MTPFSLPASAKINLSLRLLGKRADGFHEIDTLMVKLPGLADQLEFSPADSFFFSCDDPELPTDEQNLVVKAAQAFTAATKPTAQCHISLTKHIPHAAGLGGGSSDAAVTLLGLNRLNGEPLGTEQLAGVAAELGSDVPFFLTAGAARCTGRGEIVQAAPSPPPLPVLLLKPDFGVDTAKAYGRWEDSRAVLGVRYDEQILDSLTLVNNLERPVFEKFIFLAELKQWLVHRTEVAAALLCGSGSTVLAILHQPGDAQKLIAAARQELDPTLWAWCGTTEG